MLVDSIEGTGKSQNTTTSSGLEVEEGSSGNEAQENIE